MALISSTLEKRQLEMVADLLHLLNHDGDILRLLPTFGCPSTYNDWRCRYLDGRHNIKKILPSCKVVSLRKHAVIDPRLAIDEMLFSENVESLFATQLHCLILNNNYDRRLRNLRIERKCFVIIRVRT